MAGYVIHVRRTRRAIFGERWTFTVEAANGQTIATGERYHNRRDAEDTANRLAKGTFKVVEGSV